MFTVYVLFSPEHNKIYIGYTSNLQQRFISHNELGKKGWSIRFRPWTMLAHSQGSQLNIAQLGANLDIAAPTAKRHIELRAFI